MSEESTPIFDALWAKYNQTPIYDQLVQKYEDAEYKRLVEPYKYPLNDQRVFDADDIEMAKYFPDKPDSTMTTLDRYHYADLVGEVVAKHNKEKQMKKNWQEMVEEFRHAMELPVADGPRTLTTDEQNLHIKLIRDEFEKELVPAILANDLTEIYDAGIDVMYYLIGLLSNAGMQIDPGFVEVHRSNMSKMDPVTGKAIKAGPNDPSGEPEGKVLKGPNYFVPNLANILNDQSRWGHESDTIFENKEIPVTLGIGGPTIGSGHILIDHNGNLEFEGTMDVEISLPIIQTLGYSVSGLSIGEESAGTDEHSFGHVDSIDVDLLTPQESNLKGLTRGILKTTSYETGVSGGVVNLEEMDIDHNQSVHLMEGRPEGPQIPKITFTQHNNSPAAVQAEEDIARARRLRELGMSGA